MIINDSERIEQIAAQRALEAEAEAIYNWARQVESQSVNLADLETNPTIVAKQLGQQMTHQTFEKRLIKLNPNLTFRDHPSMPNRRVMYHNRLGYLFCFNSGLMPEFSIRRHKEEIVADPLFGNYINRKDLPKSNRVPHEFNQDGTLKKMGKVEWEPGAVLPGQQKQTVLWDEITRGWRTVLSKLLFKGLITIGETEKEFKSANRLSWAENTGKIQ